MLKQKHKGFGFLIGGLMHESGDLQLTKYFFTSVFYKNILKKGIFARYKKNNARKYIGKIYNDLWVIFGTGF